MTGGGLGGPECKEAPLHLFLNDFVCLCLFLVSLSLSFCNYLIPGFFFISLFLFVFLALCFSLSLCTPPPHLSFSFILSLSLRAGFFAGGCRFFCYACVY